jgi:lipopolysaccharide export system permease protein
MALRLPIKTIDRYLLRGFTYSYVVSVVIMISLYIVLDLFANLDEFTGNQKSTMQIVQEIASFYFYHSFLYFAQVAGMITLVAGSFTLARLQRSNELTAMIAGGISLYRVALPIIGAGLVFNTLWIIDQEVIIPSIADKLVRGHSEANTRQSFALWFLEDRNQTLLSAMNYDPNTQTMQELIAMERDPNGQITAKISADSAMWVPEKNYWQLSRGFRYARTVNEDEFVVSGQMGRTKLNYYESDWRPEDLNLRRNAMWICFLNLNQLTELLKKPNLIMNVSDVVSARHVRLTQPFLNMLLLFLGLPFFLNREPHSVLLSVGMCLLVAIGCFMLAFVSQTLASSTQYPAFAAWLPILVFGPLAAVLMENVKT